MLCTTVSAWSYETKDVTITWGGTNDSPFTVSGTSSYEPSVGDYWLVRAGNNLKLNALQGYYISEVEFETNGYSYVDECDKLTQSGKAWVRGSDDTNYYDVITFSNIESDITKVTAVTITYYHVCYGATYHEAVGGTCTTKGTAEYWECVCGKIYSNEGCTNEVTDMATLATTTEPTNHPEAMEEHARVEATCTTAGNVQYWHCNSCHKNFGNENGTSDEIIDVIIPKEQGSHLHPTFVAQKAATCTESGVAMNHYHCSDCGKNYEEEACTTLITASVTIPAINHTNKTFTEAVAPTAEKEGNVAYWYCPDCEKHFGNEDCTKELTEWTLEKLVNMMHLDFTGPSAPIEKEHYLNTTKFNFTDDGDVILTVNGEEVIYDKGMIEKVHFYNGTPTVQLHTNEDPDELGNFYTTFYSGLEAYTIPEGVKAYTATIEGEYDDQVVMLTRIEGDILPQGAAVLLHSTTTSDMQMTVSSEEGNRPAQNLFIGVNVDTDQGYSTNYMLSYGQNGLGFYKMGDGMMLSANKAFIPQSFTGSAKAFRMAFADEEDGIGNVNVDENSAIYNLQGVHLNKLQKGINIVGGKKIIVK